MASRPIPKFVSTPDPERSHGEATWTHRTIELVPPIEGPSRFADRFAVFLAAMMAGTGAFLTWALLVR